jgi:hypothetical protein
MMPCQELDPLHGTYTSVFLCAGEFSVHVCRSQEIHSSEFMSGVTIRIW